MSKSVRIEVTVKVGATEVKQSTLVADTSTASWQDPSVAFLNDEADALAKIAIGSVVDSLMRGEER